MSAENDQARFLKCIAEPTRLRILKLLTGGEKYVGEIIEALGKEQPLVSHHLRALKECNIVVARQQAQRIYYELVDTRLAELVSNVETVIEGVMAPLESSALPRARKSRTQIGEQD